MRPLKTIKISLDAEGREGLSYALIMSQLQLCHYAPRRDTIQLVCKVLYDLSFVEMTNR
jgi:hypothetical protein